MLKQPNAQKVKLTQDQKKAWEEIKEGFLDSEYRFDLEAADDNLELNENDSTTILRYAITQFDERISDDGVSLDALPKRTDYDTLYEASEPIIRKGIMGDGFYGFMVFPEDLIEVHVKSNQSNSLTLPPFNGYDAEDGTAIQLTLTNYAKVKHTRKATP